MTLILELANVMDGRTARRGSLAGRVVSRCQERAHVPDCTAMADVANRRSAESFAEKIRCLKPLETALLRQAVDCVSPGPVACVRLCRHRKRRHSTLSTTVQRRHARTRCQVQFSNEPSR